MANPKRCALLLLIAVFAPGVALAETIGETGSLAERFGEFSRAFRHPDARTLTFMAVELRQGIGPHQEEYLKDLRRFREIRVVGFRLVVIGASDDGPDESPLGSVLVDADIHLTDGTCTRVLFVTYWVWMEQPPHPEPRWYWMHGVMKAVDGVGCKSASWRRRM